MNKMNLNIKCFLLLSLLLLLPDNVVARSLPKDLNENTMIVAVSYTWISKIGQKTISTSQAKVILRNLDTGKKYTTKYYDKHYTYFVGLDKGTYIVEKIILDGSNVKLHIPTSDKTRPFKVNALGVYFLGGVDIIDTQFKVRFDVHDSTRNQENLEKIKNTLVTKTNFSSTIEIQLIENIQIKEKW